MHVLIILATISCSREAEVVQNIRAESSEIEFTAKWADNNSTGSRTAIQEDGTSIWWTTGEEINVFFASGAEGKFTSTNTEAQATATFCGTVSGFVGNIEQEGNTPTTWAVYPYSADNSFDGNSVTLTLPSEQHATEGTFADKFFPAIARTNGFDLAFYNVCGGVRFSVTQPDITSILFQSADGSPMAGKVQVGFGSDNKPEIREVFDMVDFVKVIAPDGGFVPGNYYFAAMIPQVHVEGMEQTFWRGDHVQQKAISKSIMVKRSVFGRLEDMDRGLVTGVTLDKTELEIKMGNTAVLQATVTTSDATDNSVRWASSNTAVATVNAEGVVTAVSAGIAAITATTVDGGFTATCEVSVPSSVTGVSLNKNALRIEEGKTVALEATVSPSTAVDKSVTWTSSDTKVATVSSAGIDTGVSAGTAVIMVSTVDGGFTATCVVTVSHLTDLGKTFVEVDLGLSVKWASFNLGATKPEEYGDYFAWGETAPKSIYNWSTYKWCMNGSSSQMTKYCNDSSYGYNGFTDNKIVLDPEDDAAAVALGGSWRMPTKAEQDELRNSCTWTWTTQNGVNGRLVTGPNRNSIFLPAAGDRDGTSLNNVGSYGDYWSSSLYTDSPDRAYRVHFNYGYVDWGTYRRYFGRPVRPVIE